MYIIACPGIRQNAPISALIKPIGLCGTQNTQKNFQTELTFFQPLPYRTEFEVPMADLLYEFFFAHRPG